MARCDFFMPIPLHPFPRIPAAVTDRLDPTSAHPLSIIIIVVSIAQHTTRALSKGSLTPSERPCSAQAGGRRSGNPQCWLRWKACPLLGSTGRASPQSADQTTRRLWRGPATALLWLAGTCTSSAVAEGQAQPGCPLPPPPPSREGPLSMLCHDVSRECVVVSAATCRHDWLGDVLRLNLETREWDTLPPVPFGARSHFSATQVPLLPAQESLPGTTASFLPMRRAHSNVRPLLTAPPPDWAGRHAGLDSRWQRQSGDPRGSPCPGP